MASQKLIGGSCLALLGRVDHNGYFLVHDIILPELPPGNAESEITKLKRYVIVAGLELGGSKRPSSLKLNVLSLFLGSMLGEQEEIEEHKFQSVIVTDMFSTG